MADDRDPSHLLWCQRHAALARPCLSSPCGCCRGRGLGNAVAASDPCDKRRCGRQLVGRVLRPRGARPLRLDADAVPADFGDRKSVVSGKSVSVRVDLGGRRIITKKKTNESISQHTYIHIQNMSHITTK